MFQFGQEASKYAYGNILVDMHSATTNVPTGQLSGENYDFNAIGTAVDATMNVYPDKDHIRILRIATVPTGGVTITLPHAAARPNHFFSVIAGAADTHNVTVVGTNMTNEVMDDATSSKRLFYSDGYCWYCVGGRPVPTL